MINEEIKAKLAGHRELISKIALALAREDLAGITVRGDRLFFLTKRNLIVEDGEERGQVINPDNFEAAVDRLLGGDYESPLDRV